jgi:hypothetical protein
MRSRFGVVHITEWTDELPVTKETRLLALARHGLGGEPAFCEPGSLSRNRRVRLVRASEYSPGCCIERITFVAPARQGVVRSPGRR